MHNLTTIHQLVSKTDSKGSPRRAKGDNTAPTGLSLFQQLLRSRPITGGITTAFRLLSVCLSDAYTGLPRVQRLTVAVEFLLLIGSKNSTYRTRNTLDCDQSIYSSRIVFSHTLIEFGQTRNSAIRSADPENPTVEPNMKWIGRTLAEILPF